MLSGLRNRFLVYPKVRRLLRDALRHEESRIGPAQTAFVAEYIAHDEFGLAHSQLVDALADLDLAPTNEAGQLLGAAGDLMGLPREDGS